LSIPLSSRTKFGGIPAGDFPYNKDLGPRGNPHTALNGRHFSAASDRREKRAAPR